MILFAHEIVHFSIGIGLGLCLLKAGIRLKAVLWVLIASVFIDVDHIIDYLRTIGPRFDVNALTTGSYFVTSGRVIVLLHSWELAALMLLIGLVTRDRKAGVPLIGIGVGMIGHLLVDQIWYKQPLGTYFLTLRLLNGFTDPLYW